MWKPLLALAALAPTAHAACTDDAKAMVDDLRPLLALQEEAEVDLAPESPPMLEADGQPLARAPMVTLSREHLFVEAMQQPGAALRARLDGAAGVLGTLRSNFKLLHPGEAFPGALLLVIAPDTAWADVVAAIDAFATARYDHIEIVTWRRRATAIRRPPPSAVDPVFQGFHALGGEQRATLLADQLRKTDATCQAIMRMMAGLAGIDPAMKAEAFVARLPAALEKCDCKVDLPSLRTTVFWMLAPRDFARQPVQTTLRFTRERGAPAIARPAKATWGNVGKGVLASLRDQKGSVRLVAE